MEKILFQLLIFLTPSQLAYHFWPDFSHVFGIRVDYLAPAIYLTDILIFLIVVPWLLRVKKIKPGVWFILFLVLINLFFSQSLPLSIIKWLKTGELFLLALYIKSETRFRVKDWLLKPLSLSLALFSFVGIVQFLTGQTLGGVLYFLGERSFNIQTPGVALVRIFNREFLRAYSTFGHPNSLAGYVFVSGLLLTGVWKKPLTKVSLFLAGLAFILSFSLGAFIGAVIVVFFYLIFLEKKILAQKIIPPFYFLIVVAGLAFPALIGGLDFSWLGKNITERASLGEVAYTIVSESPAFGVGLNNFIPLLPKFSTNPQISWWLQPVHNVFLLTFVELGVVGLFLLVLLFYRAMEVNIKSGRFKILLALLFVVLTGTFDHYWFTLQQNLIFLALLMGLSFRKDGAKLNF